MFHGSAQLRKEKAAQVQCNIETWLRMAPRKEHHDVEGREVMVVSAIFKTVGAKKRRKP